MRSLVGVLTSGRFVTRYTFVTILLVSVIVLAPTPVPLHPGQRLVVSIATAGLSALVWVVVAVAERWTTRPAVRGAMVLIALLAWAVSRPWMQDAVSLALGLPAPPPGAEVLRAATNVLVWAIALAGTAVLVDAARTARTTNVLLRSVRDDLRASAARARLFAADAAAAVEAAAALVRAPVEADADAVRARAAAVRARAHDLSALPVSTPRVPIASPASRRAPMPTRLPATGAVSATYALAVLPFAVRTVDATAVATGIALTLLVGSAAEALPRLGRSRRSPRRRNRRYAWAVVAAGLFSTMLASAQGVAWPTAAVPALAFPALAWAMTRWRTGARAVAVERRRLSTAITALTRSDDRGTRASRAGLRAAAEVLHRDVQGVLVLWALRHPDPRPADTAALSPVLASLADDVERAFAAPPTVADAPALEALIATWGHALRIDTRLDAEARALLDADPGLAGEAVEVVAEGLLNAAKHARRREAVVTARVVRTGGGPRLRVEVETPGALATGTTLRRGARVERLGGRLASADDAVRLVADLAPAEPVVVSTEHRDRIRMPRA
ncbi:hypothetical protein [uncultured Microbacterium sp.]|uniref:hypothetical protein n=1 Tax=uncultured Microbacterium sp. TaxID=191216 RepID=UPI0025DCB424|nr:hypothetical protein [uncultured Microbacterium sp.]